MQFFLILKMAWGQDGSGYKLSGAGDSFVMVSTSLLMGQLMLLCHVNKPQIVTYFI